MTSRFLVHLEGWLIDDGQIRPPWQDDLLHDVGLGLICVTAAPSRGIDAWQVTPAPTPRRRGRPQALPETEVDGEVVWRDPDGRHGVLRVFDVLVRVSPDHDPVDDDRECTDFVPVDLALPAPGHRVRLGVRAAVVLPVDEFFADSRCGGDAPEVRRSWAVREVYVDLPSEELPQRVRYVEPGRDLERGEVLLGLEPAAALDRPPRGRACVRATGRLAVGLRQRLDHRFEGWRRLPDERFRRPADDVHDAFHRVVADLRVSHLGRPESEIQSLLVARLPPQGLYPQPMIEDLASEIADPHWRRRHPIRALRRGRRHFLVGA